MKKLLLLCLVLLGGVMQVSAQITESGKIKVYVQNDGNWSDIYLYVWKDDSAAPIEWPGTRIKGTGNDVTETLGNTTYYVGTFDRSTLIDDTHTCKLIINVGNNSNQSATLDVTGDRFIKTSDKTFIPAYYLLTTGGNDAKLMSIANTTYFNTTLGPFNSQTYYAIANTFAFSNDGKINWSADKNNIIRPNSDLNIAFENVSDQTVYRGQDSGSWVFPAGEAKYVFSFTLASYWGEGDNKYSVSPYFTRTIKSHGYSTFASDYDVAIPSGVTASYATGVANNELEMTNFTNGIPAGTGALLYIAGGGDVTFTPASSTDAVSGNLFVRGNGAVAQTKDGNTNYILTTSTVSGTKTVGFYKANSDGTNTVSTDKAYLSVPMGSLARDYFTLWEENTTNISSINKTVNTENVYYNINGQRVKNPTKGLYIVNGKKVIIK